jgi:DNA-binding NtrC family response regulator
LPAATQRRLARVLRDGEARLARTAPPQPLAVRVIAAVTGSLATAIDDGRVLADLVRRLPLLVEVPPLRQRREDVAEIAARILSERAPGRQFTPAALTVLAALPWRRNVAELRALIDRLAAVAPAPTIRQEDVLAEVQLDRPPLRLASNLREARRQFERDHIAAVLRDYGWQMRDAARALGMERTNLYRKARQLGIPLRRGTAATARGARW